MPQQTNKPNSQHNSHKKQTNAMPNIIHSTNKHTNTTPNRSHPTNKQTNTTPNRSHPTNKQTKTLLYIIHPNKQTNPMPNITPTNNDKRTGQHNFPKKQTDKPKAQQNSLNGINIAYIFKFHLHFSGDFQQVTKTESFYL